MKKAFQFTGILVFVFSFIFMIPQFSYGQVKIGDSHEGGIVFQVNSTGTHGLVAAKIDQYKSVNWYDAHSGLNDPSKHDAQGKEYFDWRLPTIYELNLMHANLYLSGLGGFKPGAGSNDFYWTSTPRPTQTDKWPGSVAWVQFFEKEVYVQGGYVDSLGFVRAVRAF